MTSLRYVHLVENLINDNILNSRDEEHGYRDKQELDLNSSLSGSYRSSGDDLDEII